MQKKYIKTLFAILVCTVISACASQNGSSIMAKDSQNNEEAIKANDAFILGKYNESAAIYKELVTNFPSNQDYRFYYAESLRITGNSSGALEQYDLLIAKNKNNLAAIEGRGLNYLQAGNLEKALDQFNAVISQDASHWRAINAIGVIYSISGRDEEALRYYNAALKVSKDNPSVINNVALGMAFSGKTSDGILLIKKALVVMPETGLKRQKMENNMAMLYGISGQMANAEKILKKSLSEQAVQNNLNFYTKIAANKKLAFKYLNDAVVASPVNYAKTENGLSALEPSSDKPSLSEAERIVPIQKFKARRGAHKLPLPSLRP